MPANPHQCRLYASRFFALAKNARSRRRDKSSPSRDVEPTRRRGGIRSNAVQAISERELGGPDDDLPHALKLRLGEYLLVADFANSDDRSAEWWDRLRRSA